MHPRYLDSRGLVALWRESLLAQKVLQGGTRGYRNHPQLERFRATAAPLAAIGEYLVGVHAEALCRGYSFDETLVLKRDGWPGKIEVRDSYGMRPSIYSQSSVPVTLRLGAV